jgi:hypothetical protein
MSDKLELRIIKNGRRPTITTVKEHPLLAIA